MRTVSAKMGAPSLSFRNETPRATEGPEMAPTKGDKSWLEMRLSKITAAVVDSILRAPTLAAARWPAWAPMLDAVGRSDSQRVERQSEPRSMPEPSPAMAEADRLKPEPWCAPTKPALVTCRQE